jgi:hypothetical protein
MQKTNYTPPTINAKAFNCPNCHAFAKQDWNIMQLRNGNSYSGDQRFMVSHCESCGSPTIWKGTENPYANTDADIFKIIYPIHTAAEPPNEDLPPDIKADFEEARLIANFSPRGAAALLRLAIQKLCAYLGEPGKNINSDIATLVSKGLPKKVQQALDSVRVIGNEAVHPGTIDLQDNPETVNKLFRLVNIIAYNTITEPREIDEIYNTLPADKLDGIAKRDKT